MKKQTMSDRINLRMRTLKLKNKDLVDATGASKGTVSLWVSGATEPGAGFILRLASALGVSERWLLEGGLVEESQGNSQPAPSIYRRVPLISSAQAVNWKEIVEENLSDLTEWTETTAKVSPHSFCLRVMGDSMASPAGSAISLPAGSIVIVDPRVKAVSGNIVVAKIKGSDEATIKKLVIDGPNSYLMPLNPDYKPIGFGDECEIIGVCVRVEMNLL